MYMAILRKITIQDFRNIALAELEFSPKVNCIWGNNGEGKTNLLNAIWYLSMTKSPFSVSDKWNFRYGTDRFAISGRYLMENDLEAKFSIVVEAGGEKKLRKDDKAYSRVSDHIGQLPIVMISPLDSSMVSESGDERRRFLNAVLSQMDRTYLSAVQQYNRLLAQRNKMLKDPSPDYGLLEVLDLKMGEYASMVYDARKAFVERLSPAVEKFYGLISGSKEEVSVGYSSDLSKGSLVDLLGACREKDCALGFTTAGVQRDDLDFKMNGHPIRRCGSQGQQKSFLVALKFAQYELMKNGYGFAPMLLLDDVFDKLDYDRIANLLKMVSGQDFGQIFITDSNKLRLSGIVDAVTSDRAYFETVGGEFKETEIGA